MEEGGIAHARRAVRRGGAESTEGSRRHATRKRAAAERLQPKKRGGKDAYAPTTRSSDTAQLNCHGPAGGAAAA